MATLEIKGMNGATLLGFLAAMGSLRLLSEKYPTARLWFDSDGDRARLRVDELSATDEIADSIVEKYLCDSRSEELALLGEAEMPKSVPNEGESLSVFCFAKQAGEQPHLGSSRFLSGLLCDGLTKNSDNESAAETVLCAANGAGRQKMFQTMRDLAGLATHGESPLVTATQLRSSLSDAWAFADNVPAKAKWMGSRKPTLRWDESAERLHALRLHEPTADPEPFRTQLGAYALAANALPCFPTFPVRRGSLTSFSRRRRAGEVTFHWFLWEAPATLAAVTAMHLSGEALRDADAARIRGIYRLMRVRRQTQEKGKLTFQSAEPLW